jgi:hypothetical protein
VTRRQAAYPWLILREPERERLVMDVASWLRSLGLEQYEAAFRDNAISEKVLPGLTAEDLKDLGVSIVGHRRVLLDAIADLRSETKAEPVASEPPALACEAGIGSQRNLGADVPGANPTVSGRLTRAPATALPRRLRKTPARSETAGA